MGVSKGDDVVLGCWVDDDRGIHSGFSFGLVSLSGGIHLYPERRVRSVR